MAMSTIEHRAAVEFRYSEGRLSGPAVRYGDVGTGPNGPERFEPRAFRSGLNTAALLLQHDPDRVIATQPDALTFEDSPVSLDLRAELPPDGAEARLVRRRALRGLSVGFISLEERQQDGVRVITRAHLDHVALVDVGAYPGSTVELRARMAGAWLTATIPYNTSMACECQGPTCSEVEFEEGAFDDLLQEDVLAVGGDFLRLLGSTRKGTLLQRDTGKGFEVGLTRSDTDTARKVIEAAKVGDIYVRPLVDPEASDFVEEGTLRRFSRVSAKAWLVKPTTTNQGHKPATVKGVEGRRRRVWL